MTRYHPFSISVAVLALSAAASGCGSSSKTPAAAPAPTTTKAAAPPAAPTTTAVSAAGALTAEAQAAGAGDIPDNQVFLAFANAAGGYSIRYPEGWLQRGHGQSVTFQDKNNRIRVVVSNGPAFTTASVRADIAALTSANATLQATPPVPVALPAGLAFKASYSTKSAPDPVTNKRVTLEVDRYYLARSGRRAIVDLGAPKGVDNVDAFRMISRSFRWR